MAVPYSSVRLKNMERLKGGNVEKDTPVNIYATKWRLLSVLNLTKYAIKENKEITIRKNDFLVTAVYITQFLLYRYSSFFFTIIFIIWMHFWSYA